MKRQVMTAAIGITVEGHWCVDLEWQWFQCIHLHFLSHQVNRHQHAIDLDVQGFRQ